MKTKMNPYMSVEQLLVPSDQQFCVWVHTDTGTADTPVRVCPLRMFKTAENAIRFAADIRDRLKLSHVVASKTGTFEPLESVDLDRTEHQPLKIQERIKGLIKAYDNDIAHFDVTYQLRPDLRMQNKLDARTQEPTQVLTSQLFRVRELQSEAKRLEALLLQNQHRTTYFTEEQLRPLCQANLWTASEHEYCLKELGPFLTDELQHLYTLFSKQLTRSESVSRDTEDDKNNDVDGEVVEQIRKKLKGPEKDQLQQHQSEQEIQ